MFCIVAVKRNVLYHCYYSVFLNILYCSGKESVRVWTLVDSRLVAESFVDNFEILTL